MRFFILIVFIPMLWGFVTSALGVGWFDDFIVGLIFNGPICLFATLIYSLGGKHEAN